LNRILATTVLVAIVTILSACSRDSSIREGELGVSVFHRLYNEGKYKQICQAAGADFRDAPTETRCIEYLSATAKAYGKYRTSKTIDSHISEQRDETLVVCVCDSMFATGQVAEVFAWRVDGGRLHLVRYISERGHFSVK
jgi:hypothetical protein